MADRVGIINKGEILMVDGKRTMMERLGRTEALIALARPLTDLPSALAHFPISLNEGGTVLCYRGGGGRAGTAEVAELTKALTRGGIDYTAIDIHESSLEDIFVNLLEGGEA